MQVERSLIEAEDRLVNLTGEQVLPGSQEPLGNVSRVAAYVLCMLKTQGQREQARE